MKNKMFYITMGWLIISSCSSAKKVTTYNPIDLNVEYTMQDINEKVYLRIYSQDDIPKAMYQLTVTVDGVTEIDNENIAYMWLDKNFKVSIPLNAFTYYNQCKKIVMTLSTNSSDIKMNPTTAKFSIYSPAYTTIELSKKGYYSVKNQINTTVSANGTSTYTIKKNERIHVISYYDFNLEKSRYLDFEKFSFSLSSNDDIEYGEFRIYGLNLSDSDLPYDEVNDYSFIDVSINCKDNIYTLENEYIYSINKNTGTIMLSGDENCIEELVSFYIPIQERIEDKYYCELIIYDIGMNHVNYIFKGYIYSDCKELANNDEYGKVLNYKYKDLEPLEELYGD